VLRASKIMKKIFNLWNTLVNLKANNNSKQLKLIAKIQSVILRLTSHEINLFGIEIFRMGFWFSDAPIKWCDKQSKWIDQISIRPSRFELSLFGINFQMNFNAKVSGVGENRFEENGKCWHTQEIGFKFIKGFIVFFSPLFTKKKLPILNVSPKEITIRKRKHQPRKDVWHGEWKRFVVIKQKWELFKSPWWL